MNWADVLILVMVIGATAAAVFVLVGNKGGCKGGCTCCTRSCEQKSGCKKTKKAAKPRTVLFASFSDSEKEAGCGAKPHCYRKR